MLIRICLLCAFKVLCAVYLYYHLSKNVARLRMIVKWIGIIRSCSVSVDILLRLQDTQIPACDFAWAIG